MLTVNDEYMQLHKFIIYKTSCIGTSGSLSNVMLQSFAVFVSLFIIVAELAQVK